MYSIIAIALSSCKGLYIEEVHFQVFLLEILTIH
jgi:hypothetical protein